MSKNVMIEGLEYIGSFAVQSGQAIVGDPGFLEGWETNEGEEWNLEGKDGEYSFQGASATTLENAGTMELGANQAVAFPTGYGDGLYPVWAKFDDKGRVTEIVIEFVGDEG